MVVSHYLAVHRMEFQHGQWAAKPVYRSIHPKMVPRERGAIFLCGGMAWNAHELCHNARRSPHIPDKS